MDRRSAPLRSFSSSTATSGIVTIMKIDELRAQWVGVLDELERVDRIAWLAFFDARLKSLDELVLHLDFSDSQKFAINHEYAPSREKHRQALERSIEKITGVKIVVAQG